MLSNSDIEALEDILFAEPWGDEALDFFGFHGVVCASVVGPAELSAEEIFRLATGTDQVPDTGIPEVFRRCSTQLANDMAQQLATGPGAADGDELLEQPSPSKDGLTLLEQRDELFNRIREVFNIGRMIRVDGSCGGYSHNATTVSGVLLEVEGGNDDAARDVCMHIAAMRPAALAISEISEDEVAKERSILREAALAEGKPENIVDKMVDGRIRNYFAERVLSEQQYVKGDKETVSEFAAEHGMTLKKFVLWELGDS